MKPLIFTLILFAFVSCKESKKQDSTEVNNLYSNSWIKEIKLDNGNKWQANLETNEGVLKMKNSIETMETSTLIEYYLLAEQLNVDKNDVIKYCSMKGAPHDNLHVWLLPLIAKIDALSEAKTIEEASKLKQSIEENIDAYNDCFN
jgi:ABC-type Zn2+ transport system substrate-binding protein/surface adhesin